MKELLTWYDREKRQLPWRDHPDSYAIWVSEIMLQQTRVETVIPYFQHWMNRFPDIKSLAEASLDEVLVTWEGLGYYSRARNLHQAARQLMENFQGELPEQPDQLRRLPGIGRYTANAIASIAFGLAVPVLDGNIRRILARLYNLEESLQSSGMEEKLWQLATDNLPPERVGDYNQALMDLGAMVCTPASPVCLGCPLKGRCQAYAAGVQEDRPIRAKKPAIPHHTVTAAVISKDGKYLITQRPQDGLLGGMWEFPGGKVQLNEGLPECLRREIKQELDVDIDVREPLGTYNHAYTHFKVTLYAFNCSLKNGKEPRPVEATDLRWVYPEELANYPMGKIDRLISDRIKENV